MGLLGNPQGPMVVQWEWRNPPPAIGTKSVHIVAIRAFYWANYSTKPPQLSTSTRLRRIRGGMIHAELFECHNSGGSPSAERQVNRVPFDVGILSVDTLVLNLSD